jgi:hypothetical protein
VKRAVQGMAAGGLGQLFASPAGLVKIRLQVCVYRFMNRALLGTVAGGLTLLMFKHFYPNFY